MIEDRLVKLNTVMRDLVYAEYVSVLKTVEVSNIAQHQTYIPLVYDLVNIFPDTPWEEAYPVLWKICVEHHFFIRSKEGYINKPILEVW